MSLVLSVMKRLNTIDLLFALMISVSLLAASAAAHEHKPTEISASLAELRLDEGSMDLSLYISIDALETVAGVKLNDSLIKQYRSIISAHQSHKGDEVHHGHHHHSHSHHHHDDCFVDLSEFLEKTVCWLRKDLTDAELFFNDSIQLFVDNIKVQGRILEVSPSEPEYILFRLNYSCPKLKDADSISISYLYEPLPSRDDELCLAVYDRRSGGRSSGAVHLHGIRKRAEWKDGALVSSPHQFRSTSEIKGRMLILLLVLAGTHGFNMFISGKKS